jgi:hypothetical protein
MVKNGRSERVPIVARSPPLFSLWRLTQAHPRAAAILVNELDAGALQSSLDFRTGSTSAT